MEYVFTSKAQYSHRDADGCSRNYLLFFLNNILIFKQKIPYQEGFDNGYDRRTSIYDCYILNGMLYQKRLNKAIKYDSSVQNIREVKFPLSKNLMKQFNIPKDFKII